ncbi:unannotated protein [freshwater metagenome]|uniref:Unannotated protein n=1 Tax=freshwater metagenome TaxID=449393 RepID=A0A6J6C1S2_9ZZZZ
MGSRESINTERCRRGSDHGFDVGGIEPISAADKRVFTRHTRREELFTLTSTHGTGHRRHDYVLQTEAIEDADVGLTVLFIGLLQTGIVNIKGIGVLHDEFAATQDSGAGAGFVAVLGLNLIQAQGKVFVTGVLALDQEGEHFLVGWAEQHV